jgi:hypothetical protein
MKPSKPLLTSILIALALFLGAARNGSSSPLNPERRERIPDPHRHGAHTQTQATPQACPSVTVIVKEVPAPKGERITAIIQQQPYSHWWKAPNAPEWAVFFLTVPYVLVSIGLFVMTKSAANAARDAVQVSKSAVRPYIWVR